ncbi:hypothetical protein AOXY_G9340 [Acipenser oxyrinchus oxyrinchus]|uniref:Uncharacterized protein n=1 Tax=Acipenser oxyrinchus oxyrinchus TaxID=40147 RepID=A0AAD8DH47_ACIOX|nr:hypothetical protein AOXY_G9340 [Acipenser oxyrinchus oxyrinchus]
MSLQIQNFSSPSDWTLLSSIMDGTEVKDCDTYVPSIHIIIVMLSEAASSTSRVSVWLWEAKVSGAICWLEVCTTQFNTAVPCL